MMRKIRRKATQPLNEDQLLNKLLELFPLGTQFNQHQALIALGYEATATNQTYISQLLRDFSRNLSDCPEGVQLKPSYGCRFYYNG